MFLAIISKFSCALLNASLIGVNSDVVLALATSKTRFSATSNNKDKSFSSSYVSVIILVAVSIIFLRIDFSFIILIYESKFAVVATESITSLIYSKPPIAFKFFCLSNSFFIVVMSTGVFYLWSSSNASNIFRFASL